MKSKEHLRLVPEFIASMIELKDRYKEAKKRGISKRDLESENHEECLLCNPLGTEETQGEYRGEDCGGENRHVDACKALGCPWVVMTGYHCDHSDNLLLSPDVGWVAVYISDKPKIQQARINQLTRWIKAYQKEL